jgi:hypothetical protein
MGAHDHSANPTHVEMTVLKNDGTPVSHRQQMFGKLPRNSYLYCIHCGRTYRDGEFREMNMAGYRGLQSCPYEDCGGDAVIDAVPWDDVREDRPEYPKVPARGVVYD